MAKKEKKKDERPVPKIWDEKGELKKLKRPDFPKTKAGKVAFCNYMIEKWKIKKAKAEKGRDPATRLKNKKQKLVEKLAEVQRQITALEGGPEEETKKQ